MTCGATSGAVVFNVANWKARYPEFINVDNELAQMYFDEATLYCQNRLNPVRTIPILNMLLFMVTAHIAALNSPTTVGAPPGRLASATEGSVSASFSLDLPSQAAFFSQTKYGVAYWQATLAYRTMNYQPGVAPGRTIGQTPWLYPYNNQ